METSEKAKFRYCVHFMGRGLTGVTLAEDRPRDSLICKRQSHLLHRQLWREGVDHQIGLLTQQEDY